MKPVVEYISIEEFSPLLVEYNKLKSLSINYDLLQMLNKGKEKLYKLYLEGIELKIIVEKISNISKINEYDIKEIFPMEASYVLEYIVNNTNIEKSINIKVSIYDETMHESFLYVDALNMATNINLTFDDNKIYPVLLDNYYKVNKNFVSRAQKSFFGTMLGARSSKYFQVKENTTNSTLSIQVLKGKIKNYLKPKSNELLVIYCPICKEKKMFLYSKINEYFSRQKDEVTIVCSHTNSKYTYQPPYKIQIEQEPMREIKKGKYKKEDVFMWIINNRKYFELFKEQTISADIT